MEFPCRYNMENYEYRTYHSYGKIDDDFIRMMEMEGYELISKEWCGSKHVCWFRRLKINWNYEDKIPSCG